LAGFVLGAEQPADAALRTRRPAAFWGRGDADGVITAAAVARAAEFLPAHTTLVERVYPGLGHGVGPEAIEAVRASLAAAVGAERPAPAGGWAAPGGSVPRRHRGSRPRRLRRAGTLPRGTRIAYRRAPLRRTRRGRRRARRNGSAGRASCGHRARRRVRRGR